LNPDVSEDCASNFWGGYAYCVATGPPGPFFPDTPADCSAWHVVVSGDLCGDVAAIYGLTLPDFLVLNPSVSSDCTQNFWLGNAYCVGRDTASSSSSSSTTTTSISTTTSSTTTTTSDAGSTSSFNATYSTRHPTTSWDITIPTRDDSAWPPTKTQPGQPSYCNAWHLVGERETCRAIINRYTHQTFLTADDL
jgi:hypothetical protein